MIIVTSIAEARAAISRWRGDGCSIGLVPTMGYFHDGHLELMRASVRQTDKTVVSLFVNPTQFGPEEDLEVYPRDLEGDCAKASQVGVDLVFRPQPN
ncbi:MAG: pantoate--beta-alanine ligase, partial [Desulfofustis sp.]|nr:pantoate--beta-alanine ligase [Desulfofustis sp.]